MSGEKEKPLESVLFPGGTDFANADRQAQLLDQYKLFVSTSETLVARRQTVNTFFMSINSLLLGAIGALMTQASWARVAPLGVMTLGVTGILLCIAWRRLVHSYRQLNAGKFRVIELLERHLPASLFKAEWQALGAGKDKRLYRPFTRTEAVIPWLFVGLYLAAIVTGMVMAGVIEVPLTDTKGVSP